MIEDINKNIISAHKSNLEMEETDMHIADGSHLPGCVQTRQGESLYSKCIVFMSNRCVESPQIHRYIWSPYSGSLT